MSEQRMEVFKLQLQEEVEDPYRAKLHATEAEVCAILFSFYVFLSAKFDTNYWKNEGILPKILEKWGKFSHFLFLFFLLTF